MKEAGLKLTPTKETELARLEELRRTLNSSWEERKTKLNQALQWQLFKEQAEQAENWLASKEAFLNNEDLGVSNLGRITKFLTHILIPMSHVHRDAN